MTSLPASISALGCSALALAFGLLSTATGCNFILNPANSDEVIRCKNATECERDSYFAKSLATKRTDASCDAPGSGGGGFTSSKTNQVCSIIDRTDVSCDPTILMKGKFYDAWEQAMMNAGAYTDCPGAMKGSLGCAAKDSGGCNAGLSKNELGVCDDPKSPNPLYNYKSEDLFGQDVKDQHCRSYFCSDEFVCSNAGSSPKCVRCDPDAEIGQGGCGELALAGKRSTVYQSEAQLKDVCLDAADPEATVFGDAVAAP